MLYYIYNNINMYYISLSLIINKKVFAVTNFFKINK